MVCRGHNNYMRWKLIDLQEKRTDNTLNFAGLVNITTFLTNHIELIKEQDTPLDSRKGEELSEPNCSLAKVATDNAFVAYHEQRAAEFVGESPRERGLPVTWRTNEKNPIAWLKVVGSKEIHTIMLLHKLHTSLLDHRWKQKVRKLPVWLDLKEKRLAIRSYSSRLH